MFDLDGTLADTMQVDAECFVGSLLDVFGFENVNTNWSAYRHATDSGVLFELFETRLNRVPRPNEVDQFQCQFVTHLNKAFETAGRLASMPGAEALLRELANRKSFGIALATGGWKKSALWKLEKAGLNFSFRASAFADDDLSREGIMRCAAQRALKHYGQIEFERVIYVGDATWDVRAAAKLGYHFIGIGRETKAEQLYSIGATTLFPDYSDTDSFVKALESFGDKSLKE